MTARQVAIRRGTAAEVEAFTGTAGELTANLDRGSLHLHDGATPGGAEMLRTDRANDPLHPRRSLIINGGCKIAQRPSNVLSTNWRFAVDRIATKASGTVVAGSIGRSATALLGGSGYAAAATGVTLTGAGRMHWRQRIEAIDLAEVIADRLAAIQVAVWHNNAGVIDYTATLRKAAATDDFGATTLIATSDPVAVAPGLAAAIRFPAVAVGDCAAGLELEIVADCGEVAGADFFLTDLQLEPHFHTPFERMSALAVRRDCLRYYERLVFAPDDYVAAGGTVNTSDARSVVSFEAKRAIPTVTMSAAATWSVLSGGDITGLTGVNALAATISQTRCGIQVLKSGAFVSLAAAILKAAADGSPTIAIEAEL